MKRRTRGWSVFAPRGRLANPLTLDVRPEIILMKRIYQILALMTLVAAAGLVYYLAHPDPITGNRDLILNVSTELLGIGITVLLVDRLFKKREQFQGARIELVRNIRFLRDDMRQLVDLPSAYSLERLQREVTWGRSILEKRHRFLSSDEYQAMVSVHDEIARIVPLLAGLVQIRDQASDDYSDAMVARLREAKARLLPQFAPLDGLIHAASVNILEETPEE